MTFDCPPTCPFVAVRPEGLELPVGQVHRVASVRSEGSTTPPGEVDETKRNLLKLIAVAGVVGAAGAGLTGGVLQFVQPPAVGAKSYPKVQLLDVDGSPLTATKAMNEYTIDTSVVITFSYPLTNEPNFLLNLAPSIPGGPGATNVPGGVGPQGSIVAYSAICQHLGCPAPAIEFYPPGSCPQTPGGRSFYIHCTCHGSTYDAANKASNLTGPAILPLPQVTLQWKDPKASGDDTIWAIGEEGPAVNGHLETLTGGYQVPNVVSLQRQAPLLSAGQRYCNFP